MITKFLRDAITNSLIEETTGLLDGVTFGLHIGDADIENPVFADMVPATFTTYAAVVIDFDDWTAAVDGDGNPYVIAAPSVYSPSNATNLPQTVNGLYMFSGTDLLQYRRLETPVTLVAALQVMHATPAFGLGADDLPPAEAHIV